MELTNLQELVSKGEVSAIALDTSILKKYGLRLESGLLKQLSQFRHSEIAIVMSEVVREEVRSHLKEDVETARQGLITSLKKVKKHWLISDENISNINEIVFCEQDSAKFTDTRLDRFIEISGIEVVEAQDHTSIDDLLKSYFLSEAPFSKMGKKKHEFPDAIALMSLESWARQQDTKVIVVASDNDWKAFCEKSSYLTASDDLAMVLELFQRQREEGICHYLSQQYKDNKLEATKQAILNALSARIYDLDFMIEAESDRRYEYDWIDVTVNSFTFFPDDSSEMEIFRPINYDGESLVVNSSIRLNINIQCIFNFFIYDSVDKEEFQLGNSKVNRDTDLELDVLIYLSGDLTGSRDEVEVDSVEFVDTSLQTVEIGFIEPDWGEEDYELSL